MARMAGFQNRHTPRVGPEDFPTPPWATRAFLHHVMPWQGQADLTAWEPAANRGYMVAPLQESFTHVIASDKHDYGVGFPCVDFLTGPDPRDFGVTVDWIVTNPPFVLAEDFLWRALNIADQGVALFVRASWVEGIHRWARVFNVQPPTLFCPYAERVPLVVGRVDARADTQMPYAWVMWDKTAKQTGTRVQWIPPCRKQFEREDDYVQRGTRAAKGDPDGDDQDPVE